MCTGVRSKNPVDLPRQWNRLIRDDKHLGQSCAFSRRSGTPAPKDQGEQMELSGSVRKLV
jgi:hypothetical protein